MINQVSAPDSAGTAASVRSGDTDARSLMPPTNSNPALASETMAGSDAGPLFPDPAVPASAFFSERLKARRA